MFRRKPKRRPLRACLPIALFVLAAQMPASSAETPAYEAGIMLVEPVDPVGGKPMKAALFYPSDTPETADTRIGPTAVAARRDAPFAPGRFPLVLLSHGSSAGMFSHHDSAVFLARHGFVVAAIEHPLDNHRDESGQGSDLVVIGRSLQLSALLDHLLAHDATRDAVDPERTGVAGFSAGAHAALLMAGARPSFGLLEPYCNRRPASVLCLGGGAVRRSVPPLAARPDRRIRAVFAMSPVAVFFDRQSLADVRTPVYVYAAEADSVLPPAEHADVLEPLLPNLAGSSRVAGADHFVFLAPCSPGQAAAMPALCQDPPGVDRRAVHAVLNRDMLSFFRRHLDVAR